MRTVMLMLMLVLVLMPMHIQMRTIPSTHLTGASDT
jgi:hypothetical protein